MKLSQQLFKIATLISKNAADEGKRILEFGKETVAKHRVQVKRGTAVVTEMWQLPNEYAGFSAGYITFNYKGKVKTVGYGEFKGEKGTPRIIEDFFKAMAETCNDDPENLFTSDDLRDSQETVTKRIDDLDEQQQAAIENYDEDDHSDVWDDSGLWHLLPKDSQGKPIFPKHERKGSQQSFKDVKKKVDKLKPALKAALRRSGSPNDLASRIARELEIKSPKWQERYVSIDGIPGGAIDVAGKIDGVMVTVTWKSEWDILEIAEGNQVGYEHG